MGERPIRQLHCSPVHSSSVPERRVVYHGLVLAPGNLELGLRKPTCMNDWLFNINPLFIPYVISLWDRPSWLALLSADLLINL